MTRFYTAGGGWPIGDALLQLSFATLVVSLAMQCIVMFYSNAMQIPGRYRHWVEVGLSIVTLHAILSNNA